MNYIPSHLAALHLDELRRQAAIERRSRQAVRVGNPARPDPVHRGHVELRLPSPRRAVNQG